MCEALWKIHQIEFKRNLARVEKKPCRFSAVFSVPKVLHIKMFLSYDVTDIYNFLTTRYITLSAETIYAMTNFVTAVQIFIEINKL